MSRRSRPSAATIVSAAFLAGACLASAGAAELGDARVASHIGQQLVADVELTMVDDPATPVQARLASAEVYRGAGIAVPPALSSLTLSVMRRDGRQYLHATTLRPVDSDHLHLYVELLDKGQRAVRLVTLWLTPDPNPAPPPAPAPAPAPVVLPATAALPAAPVAASKRESRPAPTPVAKPDAPVAAARLPRPAPSFKLPAAHAEAKPAACPAQADESPACTALGAKNDELRAQLGKLEEKVKGLQARLGVAAAAPATALAAAPAQDAPAKPEEAQPAAKAEAPAHDDAAPQAEKQPEAPHDAAPPPKEEIKPAVPKPISAIKPLVPRKPKDKAPEEGGLPWGWIGGGVAVLAVIGGATVALLRRRKAKGDADLPTAPGALDKLKARFASRTRAAAETPATPDAQREAEPSLE